MTYTKLLILFGLLSLASCGISPDTSVRDLSNKVPGTVTGTTLTTGDTSGNLPVPVKPTNTNPVNAD